MDLQRLIQVKQVFKMCLITTNTEIKIATENILVYKVLNIFGRSLFQKFKYRLYQKYKLFGRLYTYPNIIHSNEVTSSGEPIYFFKVEKGFHSFPFKTDAKDELCIGRVLSQFIIPKGSQYVEGFWKSTSIPNVVSNEIIRIGCWPFDWWYKRKNKVVTYSEYKQLEAQNE